MPPLMWNETWTEDVDNARAIYAANGQQPRLDDLLAIRTRLRRACAKLSQEIAAGRNELMAWEAERYDREPRCKLCGEPSVTEFCGPCEAADLADAEHFGEEPRSGGLVR